MWRAERGRVLAPGRGVRRRSLTRAARTGVVLLEVVVALTILVTAGMAAVALASQSAETAYRMRTAYAELRSASAFLDVVSLWTREDLDRRLGDRVQGPWRLRLARPTPTLYLVQLTDSLGERVLLETALYRPDTALATQSVSSGGATAGYAAGF